MKLNLGCGSQVIDGWTNVDYAIGARLAKIPSFRILNRKLEVFDLNWDKRIVIHNLTKRFPWEDETVDVVYSSHTLEHFTRKEGRFFLSECRRVLRKNGIIRIVVPDLNQIIKKYNDRSLSADEFVEELGVLFEGSKNPWKKWLSLFIRSPHKCMYDAQVLLGILNELGFAGEIKMAFESNIRDIRKIELQSRTKNAVIVEGKKESLAKI